MYIYGKRHAAVFVPHTMYIHDYKCIHIHARMRMYIDVSLCIYGKPHPLFMHTCVFRSSSIHTPRMPPSQQAMTQL